MALLFDCIPPFTFLFFYQQVDLYIATTSLIVTSWLQLLAYKYLNKPITAIQWTNIILLTVTGSATVAFRDNTFIKWKPTLLYGSFAIACIISLYAKNINLVKQFLKNFLNLPEQQWKTLHHYWIAFFIIMGTSNLIVAYTQDTKTWIYFKLFGLLGLTTLFIILHIIFLFRFITLHHESS